MTKTDKLVRLFTAKRGQFVSAFAVLKISPLGHRQEVSRVRQRGLDVKFTTRKRGRVTEHGYVCDSGSDRAR